MAGLWLAGEVVNHVRIYGSKAAEGLSAFQRRSCLTCHSHDALKTSLEIHLINLADTTLIWGTSALSAINAESISLPWLHDVATFHTKLVVKYESSYPRGDATNSWSRKCHRTQTRHIIPQTKSEGERTCCAKRQYGKNASRNTIKEFSATFGTNISYQ